MISIYSPDRKACLRYTELPRLPRKGEYILVSEVPKVLWLVTTVVHDFKEGLFDVKILTDYASTLLNV